MLYIRDYLKFSNSLSRIYRVKIVGPTGLAVCQQIEIYLPISAFNHFCFTCLWVKCLNYLKKWIQFNNQLFDMSENTVVAVSARCYWLRPKNIVIVLW